MQHKLNGALIFALTLTVGFVGVSPIGIAWGGAKTAPPGARTSEAYAVQGSEASLAGFIRPRGKPATTFWFQWGPTKAYGHKAAPKL